MLKIEIYDCIYDSNKPPIQINFQIITDNYTTCNL